jgi:anti-sigma B factor antagonist
MGVDAPDEFTIAVRRDGPHAIVEISGELDLHASERFGERLSAALTDAATVELDARGITFIDSAGLQALLVARETARERGVDFRVTAVSKEVAWVLEIAGVPDLFSGES